MKMHLLSGGRVRMRKVVYFPDADRNETIEMPISCVLLRHAQGNVLLTPVAIRPYRKIPMRGGAALPS